MDNPERAAPFLPAARAALAAFPIDGEDITPIALGENVVFQVRDAKSGLAYALRLHRPGYHTLAELEAERDWTAALNEAGIGAPDGVRARNGDWYARVVTPEPAGARFAGVTVWTDGEVMQDAMAGADAPTTIAHYRALGGVIARLHNQAEGWTPPANFTRHRLDTDGLVGEAPFWGRFWDSDLLTQSERALTARTRHRLAAALDHLDRSPSSFGLIHADLHPGNVLLSREGLSVIDFDDSGFGWHAYDAAVALFYASSRADFPAIREAFLGGYQTARPRARDLESLLSMFLLIRGLALIGWRDGRPEIDPTPFMAVWKDRLLAGCEAFEGPR